MAFGISRQELNEWKNKVTNGEIAIITHYWQDQRFDGATSVTKVGCNDLKKLMAWGERYDLKPEWIDYKDDFPHYDLFPPYQKEVLIGEGYDEHIKRFNL
ncbi:hypothetical protein GCM10012290_05850 [Halolactibacillus alkaliphilus]|uniref:YneQ n=1 Tax=Halolactibacillus alkaliphilus TaxID=442899 RepID=A0A511X008_9BACI|nr:hypothetical protein [Halolactibacillus alkaliphilus]GEN56261.1 hypothetical protein HAL01_07250 [Halolactibacillus alkaliphilus]GGN66303.1 hypothetical protein GCM10012290_05850 [Halolactibacillus alkaliphilus]SFO67470.1 hypothetical protein SAMN05720591_10446 [Halolactibacillus alkaliphilus]